MKKYILLIWVVACGLLTGCDDFLEEHSNDNAYATTCKDLNELLIGNGYMKYYVSRANLSSLSVNTKNGPYFPWLLVMDDDAEEFVRGSYSKNSPLAELEGFYEWVSNPYNIDGVLYSDKTWGRLYEHIGVVNVILDKVEEFKHDTEADRNIIKGQSHFLRGAYYYLLVNLYAKAYDKISASRDLGVPLKLTPYVEDINYTRSPVDSVYMQIVRDLELAVTELEGYKPATVRRASQDAARALLSRVYCYMGKWELVPDLCNAIMDGNRWSLRNLNTMNADSSWIEISSPEIIFANGSHCVNRVFPTVKNASGRSGFRVSDELVDLFNEHGTVETTVGGSSVEVLNDCRKAVTLYMEDAPNVDYYIPRKTKKDEVKSEYDFVSDNFSIRLSEVYLNLAEAYAMTDQEDLAKATLKTLLEKRLVRVNDITATGEDLVKLIRNERRRELCFEGQRWFDLRRYAVSPRYPEVKQIVHKVYDYVYGDMNTVGSYRGYYVLPEYPDGGWLLPIPNEEIEQTDGSIVNNERQDCILYEY